MGKTRNGIGFGYRTGMASKGSLLNQLELEVKTYIDGLVTPLSAIQIKRLNDFVKEIKTGIGITNLSDSFDVMYILAGETSESSLKNLVKNAHHATAVNSPTFTQFEGFQGNGTSSYINTNFNPSTQGVRLTRNDAAIGVYSRTEQISLTLNSIECVAAQNPTLGLSYKFGYATYRSINSNDSTETVAMTSTLGMFIGTRPDNTTEIFYQNKAIDFQRTNKSSTGIPNKNIFILCGNYVGPQYYSTKQLSIFFAAKCLSKSQTDALTDAFEVYMDSNGKGVIA